MVALAGGCFSLSKIQNLRNSCIYKCSCIHSTKPLHMSHFLGRSPSVAPVHPWVRTPGWERGNNKVTIWQWWVRWERTRPIYSNTFSTSICTVEVNGDQSHLDNFQPKTQSCECRLIDTHVRNLRLVKKNKLSRSVHQWQATTHLWSMFVYIYIYD